MIFLTYFYYFFKLFNISILHFKNERIIISSSLIFPHRFLQITPHTLKNLSIKALDAGIVSNLCANLYKLGNVFLFSIQNILVVMTFYSSSGLLINEKNSSFSFLKLKTIDLPILASTSSSSSSSRCY